MFGFHIKLLIFLFLLSSISAFDETQWEHFDEKVVTLAIFEDRMSKTILSGNIDFPLYHWDQINHKWDDDPDPGIKGINVSLGLTTKWVITSQNEIYFLDETLTTNWVNATERAKDLKVGSNNEVYFVVHEPTADEGKIFRVVNTNPFQSIPYLDNVGYEKVAVSPSTIWLKVAYSVSIQSTPDGFIVLDVTGEAHDIICGSDNIPFIINSTPSTHGNGIQKKIGALWQDLPGSISGVSLALDRFNQPYVITKTGNVYRQRGLTYNFCPGKLIL